jgi:hypothetical protein
MSYYSWLKNGSARLIFVSALLLGLLMSALPHGHGRLLSNPQVPQGGSASFPSTGATAPANGQNWDIVNSSSTIVATASVPNGWTVAYSTTFTVGAPSTATIATNYTVHYNGVQQGGTGAPAAAFAFRIPESGAEDASEASLPPLNKSASFDVVGPVPAAPSPLTATAGHYGNPPPASYMGTGFKDNILLNWTAVTGATGYNLYRATVSGGPYTKILSGLPPPCMTIDAPSPYGTYYYVATAVNANGEGPRSNEASATTIAPQVPPTNLAATAANRQVSLTWTAATGATSYTVYRYVAQPATTGTYAPYSGSIASGVTGTSFNDAGVVAGVLYG